jgi:hypothetical protein
MLSSADMLIAHCTIAMDAIAWDAPPRRRARARKVAKSRRAVSTFSMLASYRAPQLRSRIRHEIVREDYASAV